MRRKRRRLLMWLTVVLLTTGFVVGMVQAYKKKTSELPVYTLAGERLLAGEEIYRPDEPKPFTYPPFFALPFVPFAWLSKVELEALHRGVWFVINVASLIAVLVLLARALRPSLRAMRGPPAWVLIVTIAALSVRHVTSVFENQSHDLLVLLAIVLSARASMRVKESAAGAFAGLGAAFKATPLLFAPVMLWQRRWLAASAVVVAAVALTFLPDLVTPRGDEGLWADAWYRNFVGKIEAGQAAKAEGAWDSWNILNQNLAGTIYRLSRDSGVVGGVAHPDVMLWNPSDDVLRWTTLAGNALVLLLILFACWPAWTRGRDLMPRELAFRRFGEVACVVCGMLLLSPMSSKSHFCVLLLPITFCVADFLYRKRDPVVGALLALVFVSGTLTVKGHLGTRDRQRHPRPRFGDLVHARLPLRVRARALLAARSRPRGGPPRFQRRQATPRERSRRVSAEAARSPAPSAVPTSGPSSGPSSGLLIAGAPQTSLWILIAVALLARVPILFFGGGYEFLDQQYQYIDPAWHLAFDGSWYEAREWRIGMRSWVYPGILAGMMRAGAALGIEDSVSLMRFVRLLHAIVWLLPLVALHGLLRARRERAATLLLAFFALQPLAVYWSTQANGVAFASACSLTALFLAARARAWPAAAAGLLLGLAFGCRFQDAFFGPVILAWLIGSALKRRAASSISPEKRAQTESSELVEQARDGSVWGPTIAFVVACALSVTAVGLVDLWTWGGFLHSAFAYVDWNFFREHDSNWRSQGVWYYAAIAVGFSLVFPPFVRSAWAVIRDGCQRLPLASIAALTYLMIHSIPARKSFRFVMPALILWSLVIFAGLIKGGERRRSEAHERGQRNRADARGWQARRWHRALFLGLQALLLLVASLHYFSRGPIDAALHLRRQSDFDKHLVIVDGSNVSIGGHYWLGRRELAVHEVERGELVAKLPAILDLAHKSATASMHGVYLMVARERIDEKLGRELRAQGILVEESGAFEDRLDLKKRNRRFVYRALPLANSTGG